MVSKLNAHGENVELPGSLTSFLLLSISNVTDHQRISILSAAAKELSTSDNLKEEDESNIITEPSLDDMKYETVASILRQCERSPSHHSSTFLNSN